MSWKPLQPIKAPKGEPSPVTVTINRADGRFARRMVITVRPELLQGADWCKGGAYVGVAVGLAEHAGRYRLQPGGPWKFRKASGRTVALSLAVPAPAWSPKDGCRQVPCPYQVEADALVLTLPDWGAPAPKVVPRNDYANQVRPQTHNATAKAAQQVQPYVGISERVPDPAKAIQVANGGRVR